VGLGGVHHEDAGEEGQAGSVRVPGLELQRAVVGGAVQCVGAAPVVDLVLQNLEALLDNGEDGSLGVTLEPQVTSCKQNVNVSRLH
jgi:hypothetical protein